jgi:hypothetical protein
VQPLKPTGKQKAGSSEGLSYATLDDLQKLGFSMENGARHPTDVKQLLTATAVSGSVKSCSKSKKGGSLRRRKKRRARPPPLAQPPVAANLPPPTPHQLPPPPRLASPPSTSDMSQPQKPPPVAACLPPPIPRQVPPPHSITQPPLRSDMSQPQKRAACALLKMLTVSMFERSWPRHTRHK